MKSFLIFLVAAGAIVVGAVVWTNQGDTATATPSISPSPGVSPSPSPTVLRDGEYKLDPEESSMTWQGQKILIKSWIDRGTIDLKSGNTTVVDGKVTSGTVLVDMTSIVTVSTGRGKDETQMATHLKSADFFDVAKYPTAEFKLSSLEKDASSPDGYTVSGTLKLKGVTKAVTFPAMVTSDGNTLTMKASAQLDRTKWNVRYGSDRFFDNLGDNVIDDMFTVTFTAVSRRIQTSPAPSVTPTATK